MENRTFIRRASAYVKAVLTGAILVPERSEAAGTSRSMLSPQGKSQAGADTEKRHVAAIELPREAFARDQLTEGPYSAANRKSPTSSSPARSQVSLAFHSVR